MRNDPFGQGQYDQGGAPRRRGLFGNVRWLILLGFAGYAAFFWACFWVFAYFTFPYDRLRDFIVHKIEYRTLPGGRVEPTGYQVSIVNFSPYWFTGVRIQGLGIVTQPATPEDQPTNTTIPAITARSTPSRSSGSPSPSSSSWR